jgi:HPt (histidine-containing phosphotransfer) domain-containing protein
VTNKPDSPRLEQTPVSQSRDGRLWIWLAEDHRVNPEVAAGMIEGIGHHATVVADGLKAVEALNRPGEFDLQSALKTVGGDAGLLGEIVEMFLDDCPRLLGEISEAIVREDSTTLKLLSHTVKGVACNFALPAVIEAADTLEAMVKTLCWDEIGHAFEDLRQEIDRVRPALEAMVAWSR